MRTLSEKGKFYKGNLHLHSCDHSDGHYTTAQLFALYKENGYSFLGISDHMYYGYYPEENSDTFLSIPAAEFDTNVVESGAGTHHIVVFGDPETTKFPMNQKCDRDYIHTLKPQQVIDMANANNNCSIYCHPSWSRVMISDVLPLKGLTGMEVYNYDCQCGFRVGSGEVFYDRALWHDNRMWAFATDDGHGFVCGHEVEEFCGGYINVKTEDFTHKGIIEAIKKGSFYACASRLGHEGPHIEDFYTEGKKAYAKVSGCRDVWFYTPQTSFPDFGRYTFRDFRGTEDAPVTYAEFDLPDDPIFVRMMCEDFTGAVSWSQPIWLR